MSYFREHIDEMAPYAPGEQPAAGAEVIKLNTNENPYPPSPAAMAALRDFDGDRLRLYPSAMATDFRQAAAEALGVPADWVLPGDGSDDLIIMIARACLGAGRSVAYPTPAFTFYQTQALIADAPRVEVELDDEYRLPADLLAAANAAVTFIASPNSPSGTGYSTAELDELAGRLSGLLVIDEAYVDFADENALALAAKRENVVILRTLSKGYSLAGLRLGFAVARPEILQGLLKAKAIYNVGALPCAVGAAAMADQAHKNANAEKVKASRATLAAGLADLGWRVWPSQSNFLLTQPGAGDAQAIYERLKADGILIRYFKQPRLADKLRITVGTDAENAALLEGLRE